jgi:hypothetical protein
MFRNKALTGFISRLPSFNKNKITLSWSPCDAIYEWNIHSLSFVLKANNIWKYFLFVWIKTRAEMYRPSSVWRIRIFQVISLIYYIRNWPLCSWIPYKSLLLQRSEITQMVNVYLFRLSRSTFPQLWSSELLDVYWVTIYISYMEHILRLCSSGCSLKRTFFISLAFASETSDYALLTRLIALEFSRRESFKY